MTRHDPRMEPHDRTSRAQAPLTTDDMRGSTTSQLMRLSDMDDFEIADGEPDIRGWDIRSADGRKIGEVDDLLVDTQLMKVRYVEMKLDDDLAPDDDHAHAVFPIGTARLDDDEDEVVVNFGAEDLRGFPPYTRSELTREHERSLMERLSRTSEGTATTPREEGGDFYGQPYFDDRRPFEGRRARSGRVTRDEAQYLTRTRRS